MFSFFYCIINEIIKNYLHITNSCFTILSNAGNLMKHYDSRKLKNEKKKTVGCEIFHHLPVNLKQPVGIRWCENITY